MQFELLRKMQRFAEGGVCRHKSLSEYFGQEYTPPERAGASTPRLPAADDPDRGVDAPAHARNGCGACDVCLGDLGEVADSTTIAQKILSCIFRCGQNFGAAHIADVLRGSRSEKILQWKHDQLSTHNLLRSIPRPTLLGYIGQLIEKGIIERSPGEYPVLVLNEKSRLVMKGEFPVALLEPKSTAVATAPVERDTSQPLTEEEVRLFESLRQFRLAIARERGLPPYVIFHDTVLRELARVRPTTVDSMRRVPGVGDKKLADLGPRFCEYIREYCDRQSLAGDQNAHTAATPQPAPARLKGQATGVRNEYFRLFADGKTIAEVATALGRSPTTARDYLAQFIVETKPKDLSPWIDADTLREICDVARTLETPGLKPVFEHFNKRFDYDQIQIAVAHLRSLG